jgi:hypothetical protein
MPESKHVSALGIDAVLTQSRIDGFFSTQCNALQRRNASSLASLAAVRGA